MICFTEKEGFGMPRTLDSIWETLETLSPDDQRQLRERLEESSARRAETTGMKAFHQALLASGLVKTIKKPRASVTDQRHLIEVNGKPLSETIIEERR